MATIPHFSSADQSTLDGYPLPFDWDDPLTDEQLLAIDAIEATYKSSLPISSSSANHAQECQDHKARRQLPLSIVSSTRSKRFGLFPCQAGSRTRFPEMRFEGKISYSRTALEVEKAAVQLLQLLEVKEKAGDAILGLDIEWKPTFRRGVLPGKAAVMQICVDSGHCHVMHIFHSGIPQRLQELLEDSKFLKVGVGIGNDTVKIFHDYGVSIKDVEDLSDLARKRFGEGPKKWSLASLTEMLVCKELPKPRDIRVGNWEAKVLSRKQLQYAATDAFASWHIYQALKTLPDAEQLGETKAVTC